MRLKFVLISLFIIFLFFSCSKERKAEKPEWQGKIDDENGVKVVKNPEEPLYGEIVFDLEEDLSIGNDSDENYMFYRPGGIATDSQGNIYIVDGGNNRIQKFRRDGQYLQTIGRKGQGPGEFESPYDIWLDSEENIYVSEGMKIQIFNKDGEFTKSVKLVNFLTEFGITDEENILACGFGSSEEGQTRELILFNLEGEKLKTIAIFPSPMRIVRRGGNFFGFAHEYSPDLVFCPINEEGAVYGYALEYRLFVIKSSGDVLFIIEKSGPSQSISRKEKDKVIQDFIDQQQQKWPKDVVEEGANFADHRPFYNRIIKDDNGNIYVRRLESVFDEGQTDAFDIFNREGYYLYKTEIPFMPHLIKGGYIYHVRTDEETGEIKIVRYRVKNWDSLKGL
jgi:hypothetical protein